jgi:hypothetical protein
VPNTPRIDDQDRIATLTLEYKERKSEGEYVINKVSGSLEAASSLWGSEGTVGQVHSPSSVGNTVSMMANTGTAG